MWQECKNSPDNAIKYSFKLEKPGLCFTEDCHGQDLTSDVYALYSALFQSQREKDDKEWIENRQRFIVFGRGRDEFLSEHQPRFPSSGDPLRPDMLGPEGSVGSDIQTDLDICCPTRHTHTLYRELTNVDNVMRTIIHFENLETPVYQFVPEGTCAVGDGSNTCSGGCFQEFRDHYLLVHDPLSTKYPPVKFDRFRIKSYCSCKGQ